VRLYGLRTPIVKTGDNLVEIVLESLHAQKLKLEENDVLVFTSKAVSYAEGRLVKLSSIRPSEKAKQLAHQYGLTPEFAHLVLTEADKIYCGVAKAVLALKNGVLAANAGVDNKNSPEGYVVLWPEDPGNSAKEIRDEMQRRTGKRVAVMIIDSGLVPLRVGTTGLTLAVAGFKPIKDHRGDKDLYGKPITITRQAVADDLASAAHFLMGESTEKTPVVLIRGASLDFDNVIYGSRDMMMPPKECIFMGSFL
jgi:coenzyme F420-0:L-glutamate ligase/coenzyme F420-1:gamma-L-glutamate ligase